MASSPFLQLHRHHLATLAAALRMGRLTPPFSHSAVERYVPRRLASEVRQELQRLSDEGAPAKQIAFSLRLLADEKAEQRHLDERVELVWTGPASGESGLRDTFVVVRELFRAACSSVLIATYSLDKPENMRLLFGGLAQKMDADEALDVRIFLNIGRNIHDSRPDNILLRDFAENFRTKLWPGRRMPFVFYDPRAGNRRSQASLSTRQMRDHRRPKAADQFGQLQ